MEIFVNNAILHVMNNDGQESHLSNHELDIDSDICYEFITKHIKKLLDNPAVKEACFKEDAKVYGAVQSFIKGEVYFKEAAGKIAEHLLQIMNENVDIPSADVVIAQFETRYRGSKKSEGQLDSEYLAILKLNYKECFTHQVAEGDEGKDNQIVKYRAVLPFESGKVEEACLIPYDPMVIKLVEKPYLVNGDPTNYFSELFLECTPELSKKEVAQIINEISDEINQKYFNDSIETSAKVKVALIEEAIEEEGTISIYNVAEKVFGEQEEVKSEFIAMAKDYGVKPDVELGEKFSKQQFGTQRFKASNGIEVKFPAELSDDSNVIEFQNNEDGSISIVLKGLWKQ
jgi:nucleoid-associated protein YejK